MAERLVRALLETREVRPHSVTHRIKTGESVERKLGGTDSKANSLDEIHDLLGLRIITFFPDEVDVVAEVIKDEFEIDTANSVDKRAVLDPDRFGYLSLHYVASLSDSRAALTENAKFQGRKFEIQIRSILQHAWAEIEHDLGYHGPAAIPETVRRRFSRLAGLLEIADDEFERLRDDVAAYQTAIEGEMKSSPDDIQINRDSIAALISADPIIAALDADFIELGGLETEDAGESNPSARAEELQRLGFENVGQLVDELERRQDEIRRFFRSWAQSGQIKGVYPGMSLFMLEYLKAADMGSKDALLNYLYESNIGGDDERRKRLADRVLAAHAEAKKKDPSA
ncbi:MAG TPA: hypothetical protein VLL27_10265 [Solirubrobacterales bacterium]|nr:hypothetical protein [Solirubrobacterales bacterium]